MKQGTDFSIDAAPPDGYYKGTKVIGGYKMIQPVFYLRPVYCLLAIVWHRSMCYGNIHCKKVVLAGIYIVCCSETRFDVDMQSLISGFYMALLFCYSLETHIESLIRVFYMAPRCF